jgi:hypothetical protein
MRLRAALAVIAIGLGALSLGSSVAGASGPGLRLALSPGHVLRGQPVTLTICNGKVPLGFHVAIQKKPAVGGAWATIFAKAVPRDITTCNTIMRVQPVAGTFVLRGQLISGKSAKVTTGLRTLVVAIPPKIVWQASGTGDESGPKFQIPAGTAQWEEVWSYDCSSYGSTGNFITFIHGYGSAEFTLDSGVNELGSGGSGVNHYFDTGTFSIQILSECSWTERAEIPAK